MNRPPAPYYDLIILGGGAAGFFCAINAAQFNPKLRILILEKTTKLLSKVKVSGGGRCNVTHECFEAAPLAAHYPRGQKELKSLFRKFQVGDVVRWFADRGVSLVTEEDGRMFPDTHDSQTIIDCFLREASRLHIEIILSIGAENISGKQGNIRVQCSNSKEFLAGRVLVAVGGYAQPEAYQWLRDAGHTITPTIPSLFTFNDAHKRFKDLMGVSVPDAEVKIAGTRFSQRGPVLITHWGLSGPAVIKLSAWAAEYLHERKYEFTVLVNWTGTMTEDGTRAELTVLRERNPKRKIINHPLYGIPQRLWDKLLLLSEIKQDLSWGEATNRDINRLLEFIIRCPFSIRGKTTFKEEFVTCGGVDLKEINLDTMESRKFPGLYFAGEVLNVDGETGGFNFQAAWTTAYVAAKGISASVG